MAKPWTKWSAEDHVNEAERLAQSNPQLANVHASLAVQKQLRETMKLRGLFPG